MTLNTILDGLHTDRRNRLADPDSPKRDTFWKMGKSLVDYVSLISNGSHKRSKPKDAKIQEIYSLAIDELFEYAKSFLKAKDYKHASDGITMMEYLANSSDKQLPAEVSELRQRISSEGIKHVLAEFRKEIEEPKHRSDLFNGFKLVLSDVESYARLAGLPVPEEVAEVRRLAYTRAIESNLSRVRERLASGRVSHQNTPELFAATHLCNIEEMASEEHLPVSQEVRDIERRIYYKAVQYALNMVETELTKKTQEGVTEALGYLDLAERFSQVIGTVLGEPKPHEIAKYRKQIKGSGIASKTQEDVKSKIEAKIEKDPLLSKLFYKKMDCNGYRLS
ncbi:TPA: hypothetical protein HA246_03935 [Candidatus Woesearchaeota archaeon]|nr:hypothetical protein [Candidatus Woesearchaeota archaeon]